MRIDATYVILHSGLLYLLTQQCQNVHPGRAACGRCSASWLFSGGTRAPLWWAPGTHKYIKCTQRFSATAGPVKKEGFNKMIPCKIKIDWIKGKKNHHFGTWNGFWLRNIYCYYFNMTSVAIWQKKPQKQNKDRNRTTHCWYEWKVQEEVDGNSILTVLNYEDPGHNRTYRWVRQVCLYIIFRRQDKSQCSTNV